MPRSSAICSDANLVVRLVVTPTDLQVAELWRRWRAERRSVNAPLLLRYEVTHALRRLGRSGALDRVAQRAALSAAVGLGIQLHTEDALHDAALDFAARFDLPAAHDAHYLALADRLRAELWTSDHRLFNKVSHALPWVNLFPA